MLAVPPQLELHFEDRLLGRRLGQLNPPLSTVHSDSVHKVHPTVSDHVVEPTGTCDEVRSVSSSVNHKELPLPQLEPDCDDRRFGDVDRQLKTGCCLQQELRQGTPAVTVGTRKSKPHLDEPQRKAIAPDPRQPEPDTLSSDEDPPTLAEPLPE